MGISVPLVLTSKAFPTTVTEESAIINLRRFNLNASGPSTAFRRLLCWGFNAYQSVLLKVQCFNSKQSKNFNYLCSFMRRNLKSKTGRYFIFQLDNLDLGLCRYFALVVVSQNTSLLTLHYSKSIVLKFLEESSKKTYMNVSSSFFKRKIFKLSCFIVCFFILFIKFGKTCLP